jgi:hypothetical protein
LEGNSCLLSGGAPNNPVCHRTVPVAVRCVISFLFRRIRLLQFCGSWHTGHCLVHTGQSGAPCRPLARPRVARGLRGRPLAQSTVGFTGQSGAPPDSPVNFSRTPPSSPESGLFTETGPGAPDTVRCTQTELHLVVHNQLFSKTFSPVSSTYTQYISLQINVLSLEIYLVP